MNGLNVVVRCGPGTVPMMRWASVIGLGGLALGLLGGCSEAGLQPIDEQVNNLVDDRLQIEGSVCSSDPTEALFPVKIMLIVDCSGSMQFTDPASNTLGPGRQAAAKKLIDRFRNNPAVSFAVVQFNGKVTVNGAATTSQSGFTRDPTALTQAINGLAEADILTDYQGALTTAYEILQRDMFESSPVDRIRSKYIVIFLSDGGPNPVCEEGCGNDPSIVEWADSWCDLPRDEWCDQYNVDGDQCENMENWYPAMVEPCKAYNTETQLVQKVNEILDLGQFYGVGEIRFHTAFLYVDGLDPAVQELMAAERDKAEALLQSMAKAGLGLYRNFSSGQQIDFLSINYSTVSRPFGMTNLIVSDLNALPSFNKLLIDSDADGLDDELEFISQDGLKDKEADSDGDGYGDKLEYQRLNAGFDPGDPYKPVRQCTEREDLDGDGLNGCEERVLGTDAKIIDTDRDRIPDGVEFMWGTNPLVDDAKDDLDFDGKLSGEEIRIHASPTTADPEIHSEYRYIYDVRELPERPDRRQCYDFDVRHLRLVTTQEKQGAGTLGYNEIMVIFGEGPADDPRDYGDFKAACIRAQYVEPNYKYPADGKVKLEEKDFLPLPQLLRTMEDTKTDPEQDPCVGAPLP